MMTFIKAKLATILISAFAVTAVTGTTAVVAAQHHAGPFAQGAIFGSKTTGTTTGQGQHFHAQGLIQSVAFDSGSTTSGKLMLLPNGQTQAVSVTFNAQTQVEVNDGANGHQGGSTTGSTTENHHGAANLVAGLYANVEGTLQSDGTVLASEIQANANGKAHQGGNQGEHHEYVGVVQSVDFTAMTFVLLPDGQTQTVTIAFDSATKIEAHGNTHGQTALAQNAHVDVQTVKQSDGALYATSVEVDDSTSGHGHSGATPTPKPGH